ncbi:MAG: class I SAM-dependent methyltransferase [Betaproteobacteria bacterium]|nr:MAG: class I SAM-dependent methyltransferase [Betaproteobacteria bacterium]
MFNADGLQTIHCHDFVDDAAFVLAYQRGVKAIGGVDEYHWFWRVHIGLWAASGASKLDGDFVECGVNKGFLSSAIMEYLNWDSIGKTFYLLDTFKGLDERYVTERLAMNQDLLQSGQYTSSVGDVRANFAEWNNVCIIEGPIPETLGRVDAKSVAYLHIDMNCAPPEVAAAHFFWDRLVPGAFMLLDDYAYHGYHEQKVAMDVFAVEKGVDICSLPTGQGLIIKPPHKGT